MPRLPSRGAKIRLGVVGMSRADKPILPLIDALLSFVASREDVELVMGTPLLKLTNEIKKRPKIFSDTATTPQYFTLLSTIDIVVTAYNRDAFYFRPSGVINDALASGCYVVAPDHPIIRAQVSTPVKVGQLYEGESKIIPAVEKAIAHLKSETIDFEAWREFRLDTKLVPYLAE